MTKPVLHSKILGQGKPLLILHGFLGMSDNWKTLGKRYAESGFEVHLIDQRNHGQSFWSVDFSYEDMAGDLLSYMEHHKLHAVRLLGHSMGGKTAMQFASTYPQKVERLVVADIGPWFYPPHHDDILNALNELRPEQYSSRSEAEDALSEHISDAGIRMFLLKNLYWEEKGKLGLRPNLEVLTERYDEVGEALPSQAVYEGPALFVRGGRSEYIAKADYPKIRLHFPNAGIQTVDGAGHWLHAEKPDAFFDLTKGFLEEEKE